ncbi:2880_t:CDS:2 [Paraglomus occultum]|uniref:2880_t:CDS:1 n=1 Tax=Paraglomus occultum TaxID=144539 RepID=A0A9N9BQA1_9GLOM|nr:2880_t:CDS:2 [Paraglomus occultum]
MSANFYTLHSKNFSQLFESGINFDLVLRAGDKDKREFKVHTQILYAQSTYFQVALSKKWLKKKNDCYVFEKTNIEADIFEIILRYLYTGEVNIEKCDGSQILKLLVATDELNLDNLLQFAQSYLIKSRASFIVEQPVRVLELIFRLESCKTLRIFCLDEICKNYTHLFDSDYMTLDKDIFTQILQQDKLHIKEVELWKRVVKWGTSRHPELKPSPTEWSIDDVNRMKKTLTGLMEHIRFFAMSAGEYYDEVRPYRKLFSKKLREEMLQFIMLPSRKPSDIKAKARGRPINSRLVGYSIMALVAGWIDSMNTAYEEIPYEFTLIYRASRDGFDDEKFRSMCSNKGPTVVIAKLTDHPNILGGYNPSHWPVYGSVGSQTYNNADASFIFEMSDGKSTAGALIGRLTYSGNKNGWNRNSSHRNNNYYRYCYGYGPSFGSHFCICGRSWSSDTSTNSYGFYYSTAYSIKDGTLEEYEVFTVNYREILN